MDASKVTLVKEESHLPPLIVESSAEDELTKQIADSILNQNMSPEGSISDDMGPDNISALASSLSAHDLNSLSQVLNSSLLNHGAVSDLNSVLLPAAPIQMPQSNLSSFSHYHTADSTTPAALHAKTHSNLSLATSDHGNHTLVASDNGSLSQRHLEAASSLLTLDGLLQGSPLDVSTNCLSHAGVLISEPQQLAHVAAVAGGDGNTAMHTIANSTQVSWATIGIAGITKPSSGDPKHSRVPIVAPHNGIPHPPSVATPTIQGPQAITLPMGLKLACPIQTLLPPGILTQPPGLVPPSLLAIPTSQPPLSLSSTNS